MGKDMPGSLALRGFCQSFGAAFRADSKCRRHSEAPLGRLPEDPSLCKTAKVRVPRPLSAALAVLPTHCLHDLRLLILFSIKGALGKDKDTWNSDLAPPGESAFKPSWSPVITFTVSPHQT